MNASLTLISDDNRPDKLKNSAYLQAPLNRFLIPRPSLKYLDPLDRDVLKRTGPRITGLALHMQVLKKTIGEARTKPSLPFCNESPQERKQRKLMEKKVRREEKMRMDLENWQPKSDTNFKSDPFCTIFIGRLHYDTTEKQLRKEFERYGSVKMAKIVTDRHGKSRGYGFVEYEREKDARRAYDDADGMKIDGRRVVVDIERGRTIKNWRPRRLGQGFGGTRIGSKEENIISSGRDTRADDMHKPIIVDSVDSASSRKDYHHHHPPPPPSSSSSHHHHRTSGRDRDRDGHRRRSRSPAGYKNYPKKVRHEEDESYGYANMSGSSSHPAYHEQLAPQPHHQSRSRGDYSTGEERRRGSSDGLDYPSSRSSDFRRGEDYGRDGGGPMVLGGGGTSGRYPTSESHLDHHPSHRDYLES